MHLVLDNIPEAQEHAARLGQIMGHRKGVLGGHYHFMMTWILINNGDLQQAEFHGERALQEVRRERQPYVIGECELAMAHVKHALGKNNDIARHLDQVNECIDTMPSPLLKFKYLLTTAYFSTMDQDSEEPTKALQAAMEYGRAAKQTVTSFWRPKVMATLCAQALKRHIEVPYVRNLIRTRNLTPDEPPLGIPHWPWLVEIRTLGNFSIAIDEQPLQESRKAQRRPLLLLKALVGLGGREVPETTLCDTLWPDADGDMAHQSFATTLHRLRKLLKHDQAIQLQDKKVSLDPRYCWVDVWAFTHLLEQAESARSNEKSKEACHWRKHALGLYGGPFLQDEAEESWVFHKRDSFRTTYIRQVSRQASELEQDDKIEQAIVCLEQAVAVEPLAESLYQYLIRLLNSVGRDLEAATLTQRLQRELKNQLGLEVISRLPTRTAAQ